VESTFIGSIVTGHRNGDVRVLADVKGNHIETGGAAELNFTVTIRGPADGCSYKYSYKPKSKLVECYIAQISAVTLLLAVAVTKTKFRNVTEAQRWDGRTVYRQAHLHVASNDPLNTVLHLRGHFML
jgi:hypothetical protein